MHTLEQTKKGYANLWDQAEVKPQFNDKAMQIARKIIASEAVFQEVEAATGVPWYMTGVLLYRESNLDLNTYLGNGQSLHRVTTIEPRGRGPFKTFLEGAIDAIRHEGIYKIGPWNLEMILYWIERFNGQGYFSHGTNSPYLWSWTNQYTHGKFTSDGRFDPTFTDPQGGCAAILKVLFEIDPTLMPPRIAQEKNMTQPTTQNQIDGFINTLETVVGFLPFAATFFPPLQAVSPFVPLIKGALEMAKELENSQHDPAAIVAIIQKHLANIQSDLEGLKPKDPQASHGG